jgi:nitrite reductase/ring-hydroxylating ferredoxin subunit
LPTPAAKRAEAPKAAEAPAPAAPAPAAPSAEPTPLVAVAPASAVREGKAGTYAHAGYNVAVFRHGGRLYAIDNACAHEDGPIGEGEIDGTCVRCPYHDWQYDFTTGACLTDPERARATFRVEERDGQVWLGAQLTAGSDQRGGDHDDGLEVIIQ